MWTKGEKLVTHDGRVHLIEEDGKLPSTDHGSEIPRVRGFFRGALVNALTGEIDGQTDWIENIVTVRGHQAIVRNFAGLASSANSNSATASTEMEFARYIGIGNFTEAQSSNFSTFNTMHTEWGSASTSGANSGTRAAVSALGVQGLSGTWSLSQSVAYASSMISHSATINAVGMWAHNSVGTATALSLATFASSTKGTTQALNVTYNFLFSSS